MIRQISDLLNIMPDINQTLSSTNMEVTQDDIYNVQVCFIYLFWVYIYQVLCLQIFLEFRLKPTWDWLLTVMDATEAQLKFGASLTNSLDLSSPSHPINTGSNAGGVRHNMPATTLASLGVMALFFLSTIYICRVLSINVCHKLLFVFSR